MKLLVFSALVAVTLSKSVENIEDGLAEWEQFRIEHGKEYKSEEEKQHRLNVFLDNLRLIKEHNAKFERGEVTFSVGINQFADMTTKEIGRMVNGLKVPSGYKRRGNKFVSDGLKVDPDSFDWKDKGAVTPVKDQGRCGSCWAFSGVATIETYHLLKTGRRANISEQELVDCSSRYGNQGCRGGLMDYVFDYVKDNGISNSTCYPYRGDAATCRSNDRCVEATIDDYCDIERDNEGELQEAVATVGPVCVAIDANHRSFMFYKNGVYYENQCSTRRLNHGLVATGYGTDEMGRQYWNVKNSWSTSWGMDGYVRMARNNKNMCGIATMASYPCSGNKK